MAHRWDVTMMRSSMSKVWVGLILLLAAIPTAGQLPITGPIDGQVLDSESGRPVAGAIVVAYWKGELVGTLQTQSVCVYVETTVSDADGRFHFNVWTEPTIAVGVQVALNAYKQGFESVGSALQYQKWIDSRGSTTWIVYRRGHPYEVLQTFPDEQSARGATHPTNRYLKPFTGTADQRFEYLSGPVYTGMGCFAGVLEPLASNRNLYPLYKAAFQEAKPLARTPEQQQRLRMMRLIAVSEWQGPGSGPGIPRTIPEEIKGDLE